MATKEPEVVLGVYIKRLGEPEKAARFGNKACEQDDRTKCIFHPIWGTTYASSSNSKGRTIIGSRSLERRRVSHLGFSIISSY